MRKRGPGRHKKLSSCLIHNKWIGGNGVRLKFTPLERSTVLAMHEGTVHEIEVNENTALNHEDVTENVICIETQLHVKIQLLKWILEGKCR